MYQIFPHIISRVKADILQHKNLLVCHVSTVCFDKLFYSCIYWFIKFINFFCGKIVFKQIINIIKTMFKNLLMKVYFSLNFRYVVFICLKLTGIVFTAMLSSSFPHLFGISIMYNLYNCHWIQVLFTFQLAFPSRFSNCPYIYL